jgi:beta-phosphoglucomutase family hydrolase
MIKAVIFDMDGVIIDTEPYHNLSERKVFEEIGIKVRPEELQRRAGKTNEALFESVLKEKGRKADVSKLVERKMELIAKLMKGRIKPNDGFLDLMDELERNGFKAAVATSSSRDFAENILNMLKIRKKFEVVVTADDIEKCKPNPEIFLLTARLLGVKPGDCVVIEDSANGVIAAKRAGMKCIGYINKNSGNQDLSRADIVVVNLGDVIGLVREM